MTDRVKELHDAAFALLQFLRASTDEAPSRSIEELTAENRRSRGDQLRLDAEREDKRDAAIIRLREALVCFAEKSS